jgi:hypothetical protein
MSTLETQYKNYLKENPNSKLTFEEWENQMLVKPIKQLIMEKEFIPFELSLKMKQLGFDEPCLAKYITSDLVVKGCYKDSYIIHALFEENEICEAHILVPTFSQTFRWFREKYKLSHIWIIDELLDTGEYTHEEAELACLVKLIDIIENK